jgi:acyl-CoA dehydrogenase
MTSASGLPATHAPDPYSTPARRALRTLVADFTAREIAPHLPDWEQAGELPRDLHRKAAAAGILGIGFPEGV